MNTQENRGIEALTYDNTTKPIIDSNMDVVNWEQLSQKTNWIIVGHKDAPGKKQVPIYRFVGWNKNKKYTGSILREIRRKQAGL